MIYDVDVLWALVELWKKCAERFNKAATTKKSMGKTPRVKRKVSELSISTIDAE